MLIPYSVQFLECFVILIVLCIPRVDLYHELFIIEKHVIYQRPIYVRERRVTVVTEGRHVQVRHLVCEERVPVTLALANVLVCTREAEGDDTILRDTCALVPHGDHVIACGDDVGDTIRD